MAFPENNDKKSDNDSLIMNICLIALTVSTCAMVWI